MGVTRVKVESEVEKPKKEKIEKRPLPKKEVKLIVRVANTDLNGEKPLRNALLGIKGISHAMSKAVCVAAGFDPNRKLGSLSEEEVAKLEEVIKNPIKFGIPSWLLNRRRDPETGLDYHLTGTDLEMTRKLDIQKMIELKSYKGVRHMYGLPVRGQRTRSSFRKGKTVGVVKRSVKVSQEKSKK
ncbi:MAG: 30S ribosomal protein S13 [Candidatus Aenigmatarchaeota archaeon]